MTLLLKGLLVCLTILVFAQGALFFKAKNDEDTKNDARYTYIIMVVTGLTMVAGVYFGGTTAYKKRDVLISKAKSTFKKQAML